MKSDLSVLMPQGYNEFIRDLKERISSARIKAGLAVNRELVMLYWQIGRDILAKQQDEGWGTKVIDRLSQDLSQAFPEMKGLSTRNLKYMRAFAEAWPDGQFVQQVAAQIPWFHNCILIDRVKQAGEREWYIRKTIEHGWSRNILVHQIESKLYQRKGQAANNFALTLPPAQSDLARDMVKDPYNFAFVGSPSRSREAFPQSRSWSRS